MLITTNDPRALALVRKAQTHYKGVPLSDGDTAIVRHVSYLEDPKTGALIALATGHVGKAGRPRTDPGQFGEDLKFRELWIDYVWSSSPGCGRKVMKELEGALARHGEPPHTIVRRNIYLNCGVSVLGFYDKCGYVPIYTDTEHEDDPYDFGECWDGGWLWMAKPIDPWGGLDHEEYSPPSVHALGDRAKARRSYYTLFTDPAPPIEAMIQFIERMEDNDDEWLIAMVKRLRSQEQREGLVWSLGLKLVADCAVRPDKIEGGPAPASS
jgi:hypothetical protein